MQEKNNERKIHYSNFSKFKRFLRILEEFNHYIFQELKADQYDPCITWNFSHTMRVTRGASNLLHAVAPHVCDTKFEELLLIGSLLHDTGRFLQLVDHEKALLEGEIGHGTLGARLLNRDFFKNHGTILSSAEEDIVVFLVDAHDKNNVSELLSVFPPEIDTTKLWMLSELLRDSDRTDSFRNFYTPEWQMRVTEAGSNPISLELNTVSDSLWNRCGEFKEFDTKGMPVYALRESIARCFDTRMAETLGDALICSLTLPVQMVFSPSETMCRTDPCFNQMVRMLSKEDEKTREVLRCVMSFVR